MAINYILTIATFCIILSFILALVIEKADIPTIEDFFILNILKWKKPNIIGKIIMVIIVIPYSIIEFTLFGIKFLFTWHPSKKD